MRHGVETRHGVWAAALAVAVSLMLALASGASAETFKASNTEQFVEAVSKANANGAANTIILEAGRYVPAATVVLTNVGGLQTIEGSTSFPGATISGSAVEPFPSEVLSVRSSVKVKLKNLSVTSAGGGAAPAIDDAGTLEVEGALIGGNSGAGVHVEPTGIGTIRNSTLSDGLDFGLVSSGTTSLFNSTVAFNSNGGIDNKNTLNLTNTIVAENKGSGDCASKVASSSDHSLDSDGTCGVGALGKTNPLLSTLAENGGPTSTHALQRGSPAIDAADKEACPSTDQRGFSRPDIAGTACDIGAFEARPTPRLLQNGTEKKLENGAHFPILSWGKLQLENSKLGLIECNNAFGGYATDPGLKGAGDKPGEGKIEGYTSYGCASPVCEAALGKVVVNPVGKEEGKKVERITLTEPWEALITEPVENSGNWFLKVGNKTEPRPNKGQIAFEVTCAVQATHTEFTGELNIAGVGGTAQGSAPAKLKFNGAETGELQSALGTGTVKGEVNLFGYTEGQTLTVKNQ